MGKTVETGNHWLRYREERKQTNDERGSAHYDWASRALPRSFIHEPM